MRRVDGAVGTARGSRADSRVGRRVGLNEHMTTIRRLPVRATKIDHMTKKSFACVFAVLAVRARVSKVEPQAAATSGQQVPLDQPLDAKAHARLLAPAPAPAGAPAGAWALAGAPAPAGALAQSPQHMQPGV